MGIAIPLSSDPQALKVSATAARQEWSTQAQREDGFGPVDADACRTWTAPVWVSYN